MIAVVTADTKTLLKRLLKVGNPLKSVLKIFQCRVDSSNVEGEQLFQELV